MKRTGLLRLPVYPFLLGVIPPLFVWASAPAEIDPMNVLAHVGLGLALGGGALVLFSRLLGPDRSGLPAAVAVIGLSWPLDPFLALFALLGFVVLIWKLSRTPGAMGPAWTTIFLNGLALTTVATSLVSVLFYYTNRLPERPTPGPIPLPSASRPDVWWIVLDGLSRGDWLERRFDVEDVLGPGLAKRGFQVAAKSRANYAQTLYVVTSTLSLGYVHATSSTGEVSQDVVRSILGSNIAASSLRNAGYRTVFWPGGYHRLDPGLDETYTAGFLPTEYHLTLVNQWPPTGLWRLLTHRSPAAELRHDFLARTLASVHAIDDGPPTFSFLHVVAPHAPFVMGSSGETSPVGKSDTIMDGSMWKAINPGAPYREGYAGQARWLQPQVLAAVDRILAPGARPAVVIVTSDHGSGWDLELEGPSREPLSDRMSTFLAIHLPQPASRSVPETMSSVNAFRYVFDEVFGTSLGLLPDRSYWHTWSRPERLYDVTDHVHGR